MNTDVVIGVSDRVTDPLNLLFGSDAGRELSHEAPQARSASWLRRFADVGISGYANIVAAIKLAQASRLRPRRRHRHGRDRQRARSTTASATIYREASIPAAFDEVNAGEVFGSLPDGDRRRPCDRADRIRPRAPIFNLGYYTWVEQQGVSVEDFERRAIAVVLGRHRRQPCRNGTADRGFQRRSLGLERGSQCS